jgi:glucose/arabinose dehydrogenase
VSFISRLSATSRTRRRPQARALIVSAVLIGSLLVPASVVAAGPQAASGQASASQTRSEDGRPRIAGGPAIRLVRQPGSFNRPVLLTHAGDGSAFQFVVEQGGRILVRDTSPVTSWSTFIDINDLVGSSGGEQGLLGLAFHPDYETNRKFYVNYTNNSGDTVVREFRRHSTNAMRATRSGSRLILSVDQPFANHNGGHLAFFEGLLYIGLGDGGGSGDPGNRAQNVNTLLGKMLRIDVNGTTSTRNYRIPTGNPYVGRTGRDEIWSRGLRNPWRWSFDRSTGDLWIADVGQGSYEEVNRSLNPTSGAPGRRLNYGWRVMEGRHCFIPSSGCSRTGKVLPLAEYTHAGGNCSVTGGYVYRGPETALRGYYFFGDYCSGRIWTLRYGARSPARESLVRDTRLNISSFGEDERGQVFVVAHGGGVYRITGAP